MQDLLCRGVVLQTFIFLRQFAKNSECCLKAIENNT